LIRRIACALLCLSSLAVQAAGPLPSWNDTVTRKAIIAFVDQAATQGAPGFLPVSERIAVFDMDGTLIPEKPLPAAAMPLFADLKEAVAKDPALKQKPAIAALLKGDIAGVEASGEAGLAEIVAAITDGKTVEEAGADMRKVLDEAKNERYGKPYPELAYQPMLELLDYLRAHGFQIWICSGSPVVFTRQFSQRSFGIPPQQVIGSNATTRFAERDGRSVLVYTGQLAHINDREGKPPAIELAIGQRPAFVGGNVGGKGDIAMMRYSKDRQGPSFQLLVNHNDAAREFAYAEKDNYSLDAAKKYGFAVVDMQRDWATILAPAPAGAPR
jgi:phosphoserine phosphatase